MIAVLPVHGARQVRKARPRRAAPGSRAGRGPARAPGRRGAPPAAGRSRRPPAAHIGPSARSGNKTRKVLLVKV